MRYKKAIKFIIRFDKSNGTNFMTFCTQDDGQVKKLARTLKFMFDNGSKKAIDVE